MKKKLKLFLSIIMYFMVVLAITRVKTSDANLKATLATPIVDAKSAVVIDARTLEILYQKNANLKVLPASITKILTLLTALEHFPLDDYVLITGEMVNVAGSKIYLKKGDFISVLDLLYGMMLNSGNDAAKAIACAFCKEEDFIKMMNDKAKAIGAIHSNFQNPTGLDEGSFNYTTALDMALITSYGLKKPDFIKITSEKSRIVKLPDRTLYFKHKHRLIHSNEFIISGKTGYTKKAGRTLVSAFESDVKTIVVVTIDAKNDFLIHEELAKYYLANDN